MEIQEKYYYLLPYAVMGNEYMWWDAGEAGFTEGIQDRGAYINNAIADPDYEAPIGTDSDGTFANFNVSSLILENTYFFNTEDTDFLFFALQKYEGDLATTERGNIVDFASDRTLLTYPAGTSPNFGLAMVASPNPNFYTSNGTITNNYEVIRVNMQSDKSFEIFKNNISLASTSNFIPMTLIGSGRLGSNNSSPTTQNYLGKLYHLVIIKGRKTLSEINALQTYFENI